MKTRIPFLITLLCGAFASVQLVHAATFTVTNTGDNNGVNPAPNAGTGTLRQAIVDANANAGADTINFAGVVTGTILLESALPNLADDVTISGPGANVLAVKRDPAAATNFRIFAVDSGKTVAISGLTITNGVAGGQNAPDSAGGGIYNDGALTVSDCTLSGNTASQIGGGIFNGPGPLTVSNCTFSGNSASVFGGGIYIFQSAGLVTVSNSTFSSNSASIFGGGIFKRRGGAELRVSNSTFSSNSAGTGGGAIFNDSPSSPPGGGISFATVSNCTFSGNSASNHGGGISNEAGGSLTVTNSTFSGNSATVNGGSISNGGGLSISSTILNTGTPQNIYRVGGSISSVGYNLSSDDASALLNQPTDQNNTDPMLDPNDLQDNGGPTLTIALLLGSPAIDKGKNFTAFATDQRGTGFPRVIDDAAVANASAGDGTDIGAVESNFLVVNKTADTDDGVCDDTDCTLREAINTANSSGGAAIIQFDIPTSDPGYDSGNDRYTITLTTALADLNSNISINGLGAKRLTVKRDAAAATNFRIFTINSGKTVTISGLTITNGNAVNNVAFGGGIFNAGTLTVANCAVSGNSASGGHGNEGDGGGIYNANFATLTVTNCAISSNSASGDVVADGGGIWNGLGAVTTITNSTISDNSAATDGGGIYSAGGDSLSGDPVTMVTVTNSTISGNSASASGGGILNAASNGSATHGSATVLITNSTISGNSASFSGGNIENDLFGGNGNATVTIGDTVLKAGAEGANINNISGTIVSLGYNLSSDDESAFLNQSTDQNSADPMLDPNGLQDNGGPTLTIALLCGSPAIDKGKNLAGTTTDQRGTGFARTFDDGNVNDESGGDGTDIGAFEVQTACNRPPTATNDSYSTDEDTPLSVPVPGVLGNDSDPDSGDTITAELVSGPSHAASFTLNADGSFSYTPSSNYNGGDSFTYKAVDSHNAESNVATVNITINAVNDPPTITGGTISRAQNGGSSNSQIATVSDVDNSAGSLTVTVQSAPTGITVANIVNTNGTITADVAAGCSAAVGSNTVVLKVSDGQANTNGNLTVNVTANTVAPVVTLKTPAVLQPAANHGYHTFTIAQMVQSATDDCGGNVINNVVIEKATSDEVEDSPGGGDGNTRNDIVIAANCKSVQLRAERDGGLDGRVYLVTLRVSDSSQNIARATFKVSVPVGHNAAVDSGVHYTVNSSCPP